MRRTHQAVRLFVILSLIAAVLSACGVRSISSNTHPSVTDAGETVSGSTICSNPDTIFPIAETAETSDVIFLNLDGEGEEEEIRFAYDPGEPADSEKSAPVTGETDLITENQDDMGYVRAVSAGISVDGVEKTITLENSPVRLIPSLLAYSPDGKQIFLAVSWLGDSGTEYTEIYAWYGGELTNVLSERFSLADQSTKLENGLLTAKRYSPLMWNGNHIIFTWKLSDSGVYERVYEDSYDYLDDIGWADIQISLRLFPEPDDSGEGQVLEPCRAKILKTDLGSVKYGKSESSHPMGGAKNWFCLRTEDGREGWFSVTGSSVYDADGERHDWFEVIVFPGQS